MIRKLEPISMSQENLAKIQTQVRKQDISRSTPKSLDPKNFPVFDIPVNGKRLVYVPNHTYVDEEGVEQLLMDAPFVHSVTDGRRYLYYRCIHGLVEESIGLNGECPLCDGSADSWDYANMCIDARCKSEGLDGSDKENPTVKAIRTQYFDARVVKDANRQFTFPIVVIKTKNDDGKTVEYDENGNTDCVPMWYQISESQYATTWAKAFESMEDEPTHPGGHFFILNYEYQVKNGKEPNKRDSARSLSVNEKRFKGSEELKQFLDEQTKSWTPEKAQQVVVNSLFYSYSDLDYVANTVLTQTREMMAFMQSGNVPAIESNGDGEAKEGFTLKKTEESGTPMDESGLDAIDDSDLDMA